MSQSEYQLQSPFVSLYDTNWHVAGQFAMHAATQSSKLAIGAPLIPPSAMWTPPLGSPARHSSHDRHAVLPQTAPSTGGPWPLAEHTRVRVPEGSKRAAGSPDDDQ